MPFTPVITRNMNFPLWLDKTSCKLVLFEPDPSITGIPELNVLLADQIHRQEKVSRLQVTLTVTVNEPVDYFIAVSISCLVYKMSENGKNSTIFSLLSEKKQRNQEIFTFKNPESPRTRICNVSDF